MAKITHPHPEPGTTLPLQPGGVVFRDGVAIVDLTDKPILEQFYVQHGYGIDYDLDEVTDAEVNVPLSTLTIDELRQVADDNDVDVPAKVRRKKDIVEIVETTLANRRIIAQGGTVELSGALVGDAADAHVSTFDGTAVTDSHLPPIDDAAYPADAVDLPTD